MWYTVGNAMAKQAVEAPLVALIEDEPTLANIIERKLQAAGYRVAVAASGPEGLALVQGQKPALVLLDMLLPGKGGMAVLEELHRERLLPDLPVVIISNSGQPVEIERAKALGVRDYLVKVDLDPDEVVALVRRTLAGPSGTPMGRPRGPHVLVVEDDALLCGELARFFAGKQYRTSTAGTVPAAWTVLKREAVDLVLLDVRLPGVDGISFLRELKSQARWQTVPVVIISNLGQREEIEEGLAAGAEDYIVKASVLPEDIGERVAAVLQQRGVSAD